VEKARIDRVLSNEEVQAMIAAIGPGVIGNIADGNISETEDDRPIEEIIKKLRYHKIIIMTDADVDGAHIRTLLLTFFYRYARPIIESGNLFIAHPPLYLIKHGKGQHYAYSEKEREKISKEIGKKGISFQRYKGLGEMNPEQLWETTMDPAKRTILKVDLADAEEADEVFTVLMGNKVEPRRDFIMAHAKNVRWLDV
jgi:DNA gyrase subunit B